MKKLLIIFILFSNLLFKQLFAQVNVNANMPVIIPSSPNAAELGKYGGMDIGLQTGSLNFKVPLYSIDLGRFKLPIDLQYATTGIKVDQIASRVGLGWAFNAGGVITRNVNGKPDEVSTRSLLPADWQSFNQNFLSYLQNITAPTSTLDSQPDEFMYNFNGYSGKFVLDNTLTPSLGSCPHEPPINNYQTDIYLYKLNKPYIKKHSSITKTYIRFMLQTCLHTTRPATGRKLRKQAGTQRTDYIDGIEYLNGQITQINTEDGRALKVGSSSYNYEYTLTDHLGNNRVTFDTYSTTPARKVGEEAYYPFGLNVHRQVNAGNKYLYNKKELQEELTMYDYGARFYDPVVGRWGVLDAWTEKYSNHSPYNYAFNNPIRYTDPTGNGPYDFVQDSKGNIRWDNNANSQATTKAGETYLGKTLTFNFSSYIDKKTWDGPTFGGLVDPSGVKLNSTITLTGRENTAGELTSLVGTSLAHPGETPMGTPRDYYPGNGGSNNIFDLKTTSKGVNLNFEHHTSVSPSEEFGLNTMGFNIVDVAQKLNIDYANSSGGLSISSYTGIFPSATLKMNGSGIMQYNQPSFIGTHTAPIIGSSSPSSGSLPIRDFSYYPSKFYKR